jgi:hypothetical protein
MLLSLFHIVWGLSWENLNSMLCVCVQNDWDHLKAFFFFFRVGGARDWNNGLNLVRQACYHRAISLGLKVSLFTCLALGPGWLKAELGWDVGFSQHNSWAPRVQNARISSQLGSTGMTFSGLALEIICTTSMFCWLHTNH